MKKNWKRILAAFLAASMIFGNFTPVYATESEPAVEVSEVETEALENEVVETEIVEVEVAETEAVEIEESEIKVPEEKEILEEEIFEVSEEKETFFAGTYTGNVEYVDFGTVLYIRPWEIENDGGTFSNTTVLDILQKRINAGDDFEQVVIIYPNNPGKVSKDIWNAVATLMNNDEYSAGFLFDGGNYMDENWYIAGMRTASSDVVLDGTLTLEAAGKYGAVSFKNVAIPAVGAHVRFCTNHWNDSISNGGKDDYPAMVNAFGTRDLRLDLLVNGTVVPETSVRYEYRSDSPGNDNLDLCVDEVNKLSAGVTYSLQKKTYCGDVNIWDDGTQVLMIDEWGFQNCGESFSEAGVLKILQDRKAAGECYDRVEINYPAGSTKVAANVWNAGVELLSGSENRELSIGINRGSDGLRQDWIFEKPEKTNVNITCSAKVTAGAAGECGTFWFKDNSQPAERIYVHFHISSYETRFRNFADAYGRNRITLSVTSPLGVEVRDSNGNYHYDEEYWNGQLEQYINMDIRNVQKLTADTTYKLSKLVYRGETGRWDNNVTWLRIECWEFQNAGDTMNDAAILKILKDRKTAGESYDRVEITYPNNYSRKVPANIWNAGVELLTSAEHRALVIGYDENSDGINYEMNFSRPEKTSASVDCTAEFQVGQLGEFGSVRLADTDYPTWAADVHFYTNSDRQGFGKVKDAFGDVSLQMEFSDPSGVVLHTVYGNYNYDLNQWGTDQHGNPRYGVDVNINISEIPKLSSGITYNIKKQVYRGSIWDWTDEQGNVHYNIEINANRTENGVLTDSEVLDILSNYTGMKFNRIEIWQNLPGNKISKSLFNKVLEYMEKPGYGRDTELMLDFPDDEGFIEWIVVNPKPLKNDQILEAEYKISAGNAPTLRVESNDLQGDTVNLTVYYDNYTTKGTLTRAYFGDDRIEVQFSDTYFRGSYWIDEMSVGVYLWDVTRFESGKIYTLSKYVYEGNIYTDDFGKLHLTISPFEAGVEPSTFTEEKVLQMLAGHKDTKFASVTIATLYSYSNTISAKLAEAAAKMLSEDGRLGFQFGFDDRRGNVTVYLEKPDEKPTYGKNVTVNAQCTLTADKKPVVFVDGMKLNAESEYINIYMGESDFCDNSILDIYNSALNMLPNSMHPISVKNSNSADVYMYRNEDRGFCLEIHDRDGFDTNKEYHLVPYEYRGNVEDNGSTLFVSANALGKDKFAGGQLEKILQYYIDNGESFEIIHIEETYTATNTIKASYINLARKLLREGSPKQLCFIFSQSKDVNGEWQNNSIKWTLNNPENASKNINANIVHKVVPGKGLSVKLNANTYKAENVFVEIIKDKDLNMAVDFLDAVGAYDRLVALKKGTEVVNNINLDLFGNENADVKEIYLYIGNVEDITENTEYIITGVKEIADEIVVGKEAHVTPMNPVDAGAKVVWTGYSPLIGNVAEDGTITAVNVNEEMPLYISAEYLSGGKTKFDLFCMFPVEKITDIVFDQNEVEMIYKPSGSEDENYGEIGVSYYPSNLRMDKTDLIWTVTNIEGTPLELCERFDEKNVCDGSYILKGAGKAIIRATHPEDDSVYAEQIVNVTEWRDIPEEILTEAWEKTFAITNFAKTLADTYQLPNGWKWVNPNTDLTPFLGTDGHEFPAIYTEEDGYQHEAYVWVRMVTIESIELTCENDQIPTAVTVGDEVIFGYEIQYKNAREQDFEVLDTLIGVNGKADVKWSANMLATPDSDDEYRMLKTGKKGSATVTVSLENNATGKEIVKASAKLKVYQHKLADFSNLELEIEYSEDDMTKGTMYFKVPAEEYHKIKSITVSDKNVLTLYSKTLDVDRDKFAQEGMIATYIEFKEGNPGITQLIVTADDEAKTKVIGEFLVEEKEPKILQTSIEINKAYVLDEAPISISFANNYPLKDNGEGIKVSDGFAFELTSYNDGKAEGKLVLLNDALKGTHKITLNIPVEGVDRPIPKEVSVKISDKVPAVKITQTQKVNTFYLQSEESMEGYGALNVDIGNLNMIGFDYEAEDFKVVNIEGAFYLMCTEADMSNLNKNVTLILNMKDEIHGFIRVEDTFKVKTESKAPAIVASAKSDTIYTKAYADHSRVSFMDKATGKPLMIEKAIIFASKQDAILNYDDMGIIITSKNQFDMGLSDDTIHLFVRDVEHAEKETVKFKIGVQEENWSKPVTVDYSIKVSTALPKITLGSSKLTLNVNETLHRQLAFSKLTFSGRNEGLDYDVIFAGMNDVSSAILNKGLVLDYSPVSGNICARFNINANKEDTKVAPGTYSYQVVVNFEGTQIRKTLKVVVTDKAADKCFKISKKGSIDILRRGTSGITYTISASGISGKPVGAFISGADAYKFDSRIENGKLFVTAAHGENFSTKNNYKISLNITMENPDGSNYTILGPEQTIKVTQGKPKVSILAKEGTTLYSQAGNDLKLEAKAVLKDESVTIRNVSLENYQRDLECWFDEEKRTIHVSRHGLKEITTNGKKWSVKFAVTYVDGAGNEKATVVTSKITVK